MGETRHSKAWLAPIDGQLADGQTFPAMPALSRQGSQVPLLQLHKLEPEVTRFMYSLYTPCRLA